MQPSDISVGKADVSAYTIPTDAPEGDGTLRWDSTTLIICEIHAAGEIGFGYSYGNQATAFVADYLAGKCLLHRSPLDIPALHASMLNRYGTTVAAASRPWPSRPLMSPSGTSKRSYWVPRSSISLVQFMQA